MSVHEPCNFYPTSNLTASETTDSIFDHLQIRYCDDDSTIFWAIGPDSGVIVKRAECCGKEVEMIVPFEAVDSGEVHMCFVQSSDSRFHN